MLFHLSKNNLTNTKKLMFLAPILWVTAVTLIRSAIVSLYYQILPTRSLHLTCYAVLAVNVIFGASAVLADCLICRPITYRWGPTTVHGSCGNQKLLDMIIAIANLLQDVVVVVMPLPIVWHLRIPKDDKLGLSCMFGLGFMYDTRHDQLLTPFKRKMLTSPSL